jgi:transcriptional regulator with XRE-family HTH domain
MNTLLSQQQIGHRIAERRKAKGLSQEDLSKNLGMSRPSLAQIELGNRSVNILELQKLSQVLGFSLDEFMSTDVSIVQEIAVDYVVATSDVHQRISVPTLQVEKFKNVLLYILERCAGKPNVGETVLYKLLYFSDFNHYELYEEHLTGATYRKLPHGPVPYRLDSILQNMMEQGQLQRVKTDFHGYMQTRYLPLTKPNLTSLRASEKDIIDKVIEQMSDWSAKSISDYSHKDMPWLASKEGEKIDYELVFYRETPFSVRNYADDIEEP